MIFASRNQHKFAELQAALATKNIRLAMASADAPSVAETASTFVENALLKAHSLARHLGNAGNQTPILADDSGLIAPALNGAPGVKSARFANLQDAHNSSDAANIAALLTAMQGIADRRAYFYCVLVCLRYPSDPAPIMAGGTWHGEIAKDTQGAHGFGYDPVFYIPSLNQRAAELTQDKKTKLSHRGQALRQLIAQL